MVPADLLGDLVAKPALHRKERAPKRAAQIESGGGRLAEVGRRPIERGPAFACFQTLR
jgi:hypothetical protein